MRTYLDVFGDLARFSLGVIGDIFRLGRCGRCLRLSRRLRLCSSLNIWVLLSSGRLLFLFVHVAWADGRHAFPSPLRLAFRSSSAPKLFHDARHFAMDHRVRPVPTHLPRAGLTAILAVGRGPPECVHAQDAARLVLTATLALTLRVEGGAEHAARVLVRPIVLLVADNARRDNKEVGGDELEARGEREEPRVERAFSLGLSEGRAVVEVGMREDAPKAARKGGEVPVGGCWDGQAGGEVAGRVQERGRAV